MMEAMTRTILLAMAVAACGAPARPTAGVENRARPEPVGEAMRWEVIEGHVIDARTGKGMVGAIVNVLSPDGLGIPHQTNTDGHGRYRVLTSAGRWNVQAYYSNAMTETTVDVPSARARSLDFTLEPHPDQVYP